MVSDRIAYVFFPIGKGHRDTIMLDIGRPFLWAIPVVVVLGLLGALLEGLGIGLLVPLMYVSLSQTIPDNIPTLLRPLAELTRSFDPDVRLLYIGGVILALILLKAFVIIANANLLAAIDGRVGHRIRRKLAAHLLRTDYPYFLQHDAADLVNLVATDSWRASEATRHIFRLVAATAALLVFGTFLCLIEWRLFLMVGAGVLLIRAGQSFYSRRVRKKSVWVSRANETLAQRMLHLVTGVRIMRVFGRDRYEKARFDEASEDVRRAMFEIERATLVVGPIFEFCLALLLVATLLASTRLGVELPVTAAFLVLLYRLQPHLRTVSEARVGLASLQGSIDVVARLLHRPVSPAESAATDTAEQPAGAARPVPAGASIHFENVSYRFPGSDRGGMALREASFSIPHGRTTALIGRSGAGKTTIVNLLCRLLEPSEGRIRVGEDDLDTLDIVAWRRQIALAGQDIDLIEGTIRENLIYGCPDASDEDIYEAARVADVLELVQGLPQGLDTSVTTRGLNLSGGQRQRLGLARALLRRPELLILDEATNAVDGVSETAIIRLLQDSRWFETGLIISHRRSTLAACDYGIVLQDGGVVEQGAFASLDYVDRMEAPFVSGEGVQ